MDWIKELIKDLPLDLISEIIADIVAWWSYTVQNIPAEDLSFNVYVGGSLVVCLLWFFIARVLPRQFAFISWVIVFAVLFTPAVSTGKSAEIVPACVATVYSVLMKDTYGAIMNLLSIISVIFVIFLLNFIWQMIWFIISEDFKEKPSENISGFLAKFVKNDVDN